MAKKRKKKSSLKSNSDKKAFIKKLQMDKFSSLVGGTGKRKPRTSPLWTPEQGISYSQLGSKHTCDHRFHLSEVQGWQPTSINLPLEFGNMFHHMDEAFGDGYDERTLIRIPTNYVKIQAKERSMTDDEFKSLSFTAAMVGVTYIEYIKHWKENPSFELEGKDRYEKSFKWIEREGSFRIPHHTPTFGKIDLRGKRDGAFRVYGVKGAWLLETKTKGNIDPSAIEQSLHKDLQTGIYMTAMQHEMKEKPRGVLYNVVRRSALKPRIKDTPEMYGQRVQEHIQSDPWHYFHRFKREITQQELDDFIAYTLNPEIHKLMVWWRSIEKKPMDPFHTDCERCLGKGKWRDRATKRKGTTEFIKCKTCNGSGRVPNPWHSIRAFEQYDAISRGMRGDFFDIICNEDYSRYCVRDVAYPELENNDCAVDYM